MRKYFCTANTCEGFVNFTEYNLDNMEKIYSVKSAPKGSLDLLVRKIGEFFEKLELQVEYVVSSVDMGIYCGVFVRKAGIAVLDYALYSEGKIVVLDEYNADDEEEGKFNEFLNLMYEEYRKAKEIHDEWEKIYIENMDFERLDEFGKKVIDSVFKDNKADKKAVEMKRFFGASAPGGAVNYINLLTDDLEKRFFIKGRPGTGKSTFLKKVAKEAEQRGFNTEIYCCSFDPKSLDMVVVRELGFCIFDSTAPHELFPVRENDAILDFYAEAGLLGVDEKYEKELLTVGNRYSEVMKNGIDHLRNAVKIHTVRERILSSFTDYEKIDKISKIICVD